MKVETLGHGWREVSRRVMNKAPCTVAVIVDRGFGENEEGGDRVCVVFFGGPDDREALELGARMADHPAVKVTVIRFVENNGRDTNTVTLRPSPEKFSESNCTFSVAAVKREEEGVIFLYIFQAATFCNNFSLMFKSNIAIDPGIQMLIGQMSNNKLCGVMICILLQDAF